MAAVKWEHVHGTLALVLEHLPKRRARLLKRHGLGGRPARLKVLLPALRQLEPLRPAIGAKNREGEGMRGEARRSEARRSTGIRVGAQSALCLPWGRCS